MKKLLKNVNLNPKICFGIIAFFFCAFILLCSFLYPFTSDEVRGFIIVRENFLRSLSDMFFTEAPRFMNLLMIVGSYLGPKFKIFFCIINPLIQLCIVYSLFYFIKGRRLDINRKADVFPFLLICLMYLFMVPSPSTTLFWIAGASNYSWVFLFCLFILCLYRFTYERKIFKSVWYINLLWLFIGFVSGMSNENTGPMMLGLSFCFILFCKYKKFKTPKYIYFSFVGILAGVAAMFGFGGSSARLSSYVYTFFVNASLSKKLFFSLYHFNKFLKALYFLPVITGIALLLVLYDKKNKVLKSEKFILSLFFLLCGLVLAFVLFAAPLVPERAYYSAGIFCFISFLFFLDLFKDVYKIYLLKYFTLFFTVYCLIIFPLVLVPYFSLYKNFKKRDAQIILAKEKGKDKAYTDTIPILAGPTKNLTITYLDLVKHHSERHKVTLKKWYGIEVVVPQENKFEYLVTNNLLRTKEQNLTK